jgi:repressor LexA
VRPKATLTKRWKTVLDFIRAYSKIHGVAPSYDTIALGLGMKSRSNIHRMVKRMEEEGLLVREPRKFYALRVVDDRGVMKL